MPFSHEYCLCALGIRTNKSDKLPTKFSHDRFFYNPLIPHAQKIISDVKNVSVFSLRITTNHHEPDNQYLSVFFKPDPDYFRMTQKLPYKRLLNLFFNLPQEVNTDPLPRPDKIFWSDEWEQEIYDSIRMAHLDDNISDSIPHQIQCNGLDAILLDHQRNAVRWMLHREIDPISIDTEYIQIACFSFPEIPFYINTRTLQITDEKPMQKIIPPGGVLADEMGLGKTVEILALIMLHQKPMELCKWDAKIFNQIAAKVVDKSKLPFKCLCQSKGRRNSADLLCCTICNYLQHAKCVAPIFSQPNEAYVCPECWESTEPIPSKATLIIAPLTLITQWQEEIEKFIYSTNFKILRYEGIKKKWIRPTCLAKYDIVITDYSTVRTEIYFTNQNKQRTNHLRNKSQYLKTVSPLPMLKWWRIIIDEGQMVDMPRKNISQMLQTLSAEHRWAVTGTPIEKGILDFYGLLCYLGYEPFNDLDIMIDLVDKYSNDDKKPLINVMKNILWRTSKKDVWHQLQIPAITELVHDVIMSDVQEFFYKQQHIESSNLFRERAAKLSQKITFNHAKNTVLRMLLEPLHKLRLNCSLPTLFNKSILTNGKKVLNHDDLLKHLKGNAENKCKSEIRSIISISNGLAALYVIKKDYTMAKDIYKTVLNAIKDYTGKISVDSLLQIHTLHNLLDIMDRQEIFDYPEKNEYKMECSRLEQKYIEQSAELVSNHEAQRLNLSKRIEKQQTDQKNDVWYLNIIGRLSTNSQTVLLDKINEEIHNNYSSVGSFVTLETIGYFITTWMDKVKQKRIEIAQLFESLKYFSDNILTPKNEMPAETLKNCNQLIQSALECHLSIRTNKDGDESDDEEMFNVEMARGRVVSNVVCELCILNRVLKEYECIIFDKIYVDAKDRDNKGSWNPSLPEAMLKIIYTHGYREQRHRYNLKDGKLHLAIIKSIQMEFKEYRQLWVEVNHAVSKNDELNMCKSRLQAYDPMNMPPEMVNLMLLRPNLLIPIYQVAAKIDESIYQMEEAKTTFSRCMGTLKYLQHLEDKVEIDVCPICRSQPKQKYCVLECGHHICLICLEYLKSMNSDSLNCVICRNKQTFNSLYFVTCKKKPIVPTEENGVYTGDYSNKIEEIVRTAIELKENDPNVKILICSTWTKLLKVIAEALQENNIQSRLLANNSNKSITEFKDPNLNVTCLLLQLQSGTKGLNLTEATHVFFAEPFLHIDAELQSIGRIHRIGQTKPTFVHRFIVRNTIEDTIWKARQTKDFDAFKNNACTAEFVEKLFYLHSTENTTEYVE